MKSQFIPGIHIINKPVGITSHDVVARIRRISGIQRVGHAGTLDPFAEGLLIILVGREYTKRQSEFLLLNKEYEATIRLGAVSSTEDTTGIITYRECVPIDQITLEKTLTEFIGAYDQIPSAFSAKKIEGVRAYTLARKGMTPNLKAKNITIFSLELISYDWPHATIKTKVSSGTYIRALARDIGELLGCGAYVETLKRTNIGSYSLSEAIKLEEK